MAIDGDLLNLNAMTLIGHWDWGLGEECTGDSA